MINNNINKLPSTHSKSIQIQDMHKERMKSKYIRLKTRGKEEEEMIK